MQTTTPKTWLIIGASRGIGLELTSQLTSLGSHVLATARDPAAAPLLETVRATTVPEGRCLVFTCDVASESSIGAFVGEVGKVWQGRRIDYVVVNAGILDYPNRATELSFSNFANHLHTNTIGPIITAQTLLKSPLSIGTIVFMSSDSGSASRFRDFEDGFAAYAASKAALNQMLRHMAAELKRKGSETTILAMHPGEVATDMANVEVAWEVEGVITPRDSVAAMIPVIEGKGVADSGSFWTWEGERYPW